MADFKVGDVVQLKGGGEIMTVVAIHKDGILSTAWHLNGKEEKATYPADALVEYKEPDMGY